MRISDPGEEILHAATAGDLDAIEAVLRSIQGGVFNLAVRMLGNRDDAADATQEILLRVVTHLGAFRGDAKFTTWVFSVARNHLLTASTAARESPEVSLDAMAERLQAGLAFIASVEGATSSPSSVMSLSPEDKLEARQTAIRCTQGMLMTLSRTERLAYLLDTVFGLSAQEAAAVLDVGAAAYRQRLSRARAALDGFAGANCGLTNPDAACRCGTQTTVMRRLQGKPEAEPSRGAPLALVHREEFEEAERQFDAIVRMGDAAAVFHAHPAYRAPQTMIGAIRAVLRVEGHWES